MQPSCDVVHVVPANNFGAFVNSATRMPRDRSKSNKALCQLFLWTYLIPGLVVYSIFYSMKFKLSTAAPFLYAYFVLATILNFCIFKRIVDAEQGTSNNAATDMESPPSGTPTDSPPTYWEAVKDPPSYSFLQYYRRMMSSKSWIQRNNSLEKHNSSGSTSIPQTPSSTARNPKFNRNVSCPA